MTRSPSSLTYQGLFIDYQPSTGLVCLTDLWQAQCSPTKQRPLAWMRLGATQTILKQIADCAQVEPVLAEWHHLQKSQHPYIWGIPGVLETVEHDGTLRTYASRDLATVYAQFLAPECYQWAVESLDQDLQWVEAWVNAQIESDANNRQTKLTRRAVIAAGWSIPIVTTLALNQQALAQVSPGVDDDDDGLDDDDDDSIPI
ncbi:MAG TPA: hypothetical protein ACFE0H_03380 [Elainellaceae cyanobacterium]